MLSTSRTSRLRVRSRSSWIGPGGTNLGRINPCASNSAIQVASLTSVVRVGTFRTCWAFASARSNASQSTCHTGFHYTPLASIATWVQSCSANQSEIASSSLVVLPKLRTSHFCGAVTQRTQATITSLRTSSLAQRDE